MDENDEETKYKEKKRVEEVNELRRSWCRGRADEDDNIEDALCLCVSSQLDPQTKFFN